ncbi:hypothetical protein AYL99_01862 [Fonsecaea erecta]|uniref:Uncharacterized protein n=1 Tax=Fonsecaea erecta TaxID=1367422 RepID=A0A178ZU84_9EURO|nr:hypothetical protein AYL99_01862 [Fonsecaea erecta]OAP62635.1 hypothetical protein AYL99_01862 [Fonsecaea erecta]
MAFLATMTAASPTSTQWQRSDASDTGVAHYGKPSGTAAGGNMGSQDAGDWQHSPTGHIEEDEHDGSFQENDDTFKQHHPRSADVLETFRRMAQQKDDHDHHGDSHGNDQNMEGASRNDAESGEDGKGKYHDTRATTERGVYECSGQNWQHPCVWTPLKEGQCYNRLYGRLGSMGPDNGLSCTIYEQPNCNDHGWNTCGPFVYPGIPNYQTSHLLLYNGMSDDGIFSIKCKYT